MKNKRLILIVCLVLLVFGFSTATAEGTETVITITCEPGSLMAENTTLTQICETAAIRINAMPEGYGAFTLLFNEVDTLQCLFRLEDSGLYLQSQSTGATPLYFSWEDLMNFIMDQLENNPDLGEINAMFDPDMLQSMLDGSMTDEQAMDMMGIDDELLEFISDIEALQTVQTGSFTLDGSDVANQKTVIALTKDELIRAVDLNVVRNMIASQLQMSSAYLTEEEINAEVDAQLDEVKQSIEESNLAVTYSIYTAADEFVAFELVVSGAMDNGDGSEDSLGITATVTKTTVGQAAFYQLSVDLFEGENEMSNQYGSLYIGDGFVTGTYLINSIDGEEIMSAALSFDTSVPGQKTGEVTLTVNDGYSETANTALVTFDQTIDENITDTVIAVYYGAGSVDSVKASLAQTDLIAVRFHTVEQPDSGFFSGLQAATPETAMQPMQMTEDELNEYMANIWRTWSKA